MKNWLEEVACLSKMVADKTGEWIKVDDTLSSSFVLSPGTSGEVRNQLCSSTDVRVRLSFKPLIPGIQRAINQNFAPEYTIL